MEKQCRFYVQLRAIQLPCFGKFAPIFSALSLKMISWVFRFFSSFGLNFGLKILEILTNFNLNSFTKKNLSVTRLLCSAPIPKEAFLKEQLERQCHCFVQAKLIHHQCFGKFIWKYFKNLKIECFALKSFLGFLSWNSFLSRIEIKTNSLLAEPVGFKAPVFSTDSKTFRFERDQNTTLALLCPSQAFPVPVYR